MVFSFSLTTCSHKGELSAYCVCNIYMLNVYKLTDILYYLRVLSNRYKETKMVLNKKKKWERLHQVNDLVFCAVYGKVTNGIVHV